MKNILIISCGPGIDEIRKDFGHAIDWIQNGVDKFYSVDNGNSTYYDLNACKFTTYTRHYNSIIW